MATVLDRPPEVGLKPGPPASSTITDAEERVGLMQWVVAALLVGAGAVHLVMAPAHLAESAAEGVGFLVAGWLQLALAVAVVLRPSRRVAIAVIVVSAACLAAWAVSRTTGFPFGAHAGHAESVTTVDGLTVLMEVATVAAAAALCSPSVLRVRSAFFAFNAGLLVLVVTTIAIASPDARDHAAASHGDHATADHDLVVGAASPGSGAVSAAAPHDHDAVVSTSGGAPTDLNGHTIDGVKAQDVAAEHQPDVPLDPATRAVVAEQLVVARQLAMQYPTAADAEAAGYRLVAGFGPGSGAHYIGGPMTGPGPFDPSHAQSLIYAGTTPTSPIVGLMYFGLGEAAPEGFAGPNDHWHRHSSVCTTFANGKIDVPFPPDHDVTQEQCTSIGGRYMQTTGWMVHAWVVPGWESPSGVFSHENPNLRCADGTYNTDSVGTCQGL